MYHIITCIATLSHELVLQLWENSIFTMTDVTPGIPLLSLHWFNTMRHNIPAYMSPIQHMSLSSHKCIAAHSVRVLYSVVHHHLPLLIGTNANENSHSEINGSHATVVLHHASCDM